VIVFSTFIWQGAEPALAYIDATTPVLSAAGASTAAIEVATERVQACLLAGHLEAAVLDADRLLERPMPPRARQAAMIFSARALGMMGHLDEAEARLDSIEPELTDDYLGRGEWLHVRAELALWGGRPGRAAELIDEVLRIPGPIRGAHAMPELTLAWARWSAGDPVEPARSAVATPIQAGIGPELDGLICLASGDTRGAADRFATAAQAWSGFSAEHVVRCDWARGEALRLAGERDTALTQLESALERAVADGFAIEAARIRRSMRQAGIRVGVSAGRARTSASLTPRERELVALVARGHSNIEVARRMGLGRPTVARMLSNAMTRLGAQNRAQLVAMVADLDD
jgi:DNA-binding CsgD family transcriptional regulator